MVYTEPRERELSGLFHNTLMTKAYGEYRYASELSVSISP